MMYVSHTHTTQHTLYPVFKLVRDLDDTAVWAPVSDHSNVNMLQWFMRLFGSNTSVHGAFILYLLILFTSAGKNH